jgi:SAM-dependent methyltransferase
VPKPKRQLADTFLLDDVARAYAARPPYPLPIIDRLADLAGGGRVLDLGAGDGALSRPLASRGLWVDAVERSLSMARAGRAAAGGDEPHLRWFVESAEEFTATGPYALAVCGDSMHWFDLPVVMTRLKTVVAPGGVLALTTRSLDHPSLRLLTPVIRRFSRAGDYDPQYQVADDLTTRGLWDEWGQMTTIPTIFRQSVNDYVTALRSTASLARGLMSDVENAAFDEAALSVLRRLADDGGTIPLQLTASLAWGRPR